MRLGEAWRLSKTPYDELTYRSAMMTRGSSRRGIGIGASPAAAVRSIRRGAMTSKILFTVFVGIASVFPFSQFASERSPATLVTAVTFTLAISLAYVVLYSLQVLPSFSSAEPFVLLSTLPLSDGDASLLTMLSVVRTFDSIIIVSVVAQIATVAYLTSSLLAGLAMALAAVVNVIFGVAISLWLSGVFQRNVTRGGRGKGAAIGRFVFLISWGLAAASLGFLFNIVTYAVPALDSAVSGALASTVVPLIFSLVHPFSAGMVVASLAFPAFSSISRTLSIASALSFAALAGYVLLACLAARRTLATAANVVHGPTMTVVRQRASEFLLRLRRPIPAYVLKDARMASKNPSVAIVFGLPVLETLIIVFTTSGISSMRAHTVLSSTALGCVFTLISASVLLNTEGSGLDYTLSLPLNANVMVFAKSIIATLAYLPVPVAIGVLLAIGRSPSPWLFALPILETAAVSAATSAELSFFIQSYRKGRGRRTSSGIETRGLSLMSPGDLLRLAAALVVAGALSLGPLAVYAGAYLLTTDHGLAVASMALLALAEFAGVQLYLRRS